MSHAEKPCPGCGDTGFWTKYMGKTGERMTRTGECYTCAHWELICEVGEKVVIDHAAYSIGYEPKDEDERFHARLRNNLGMSGRRFDIEFFDGRKITTHNLWSGGVIPERYWSRLPDTAKFIGGAERAQVGETTCWNPSSERDPAYPAYDAR